MVCRAYLLAAYKLALWNEIRNRLTSIMLSAKEGRTDIVARQAPYEERFVSLQATREMLDDALAEERALTEELERWQWVRQPSSPAVKPGPRRGH